LSQAPSGKTDPQYERGEDTQPLKQTDSFYCLILYRSTIPTLGVQIPERLIDSDLVGQVWKSWVGIERAGPTGLLELNDTRRARQASS
jgi:hypothetical protein